MPHARCATILNQRAQKGGVLLGVDGTLARRRKGFLATRREGALCVCHRRTAQGASIEVSVRSECAGVEE